MTGRYVPDLSNTTANDAPHDERGGQVWRDEREAPQEDGEVRGTSIRVEFHRALFFQAVEFGETGTPETDVFDHDSRLGTARASIRKKTGGTLACTRSIEVYTRRRIFLY